MSKEYEIVHECDYSKGVDIESARVEEWIDEIIGTLEEGEYPMRVISSGNTMVVGSIDQDDDIQIRICKQYTQRIYRKN